MVTIRIMEHINHSEIIDKLGGTVAVARICNVSSQAVSKWRIDGIPEARIMYIKLLNPDLFQQGPKDSKEVA